MSTWNEIFQDLWDQIVDFVPQLGAALVILIVGLIIASLLSKVVYKILSYIRIDTLFGRIPTVQHLKTQGITLNISDIVTQIVKWFFIIVTLMAVSDILQLEQINIFLESVLFYIPNVIVAVIIFAIGFILGQFTANIIRNSALATKLSPKIANILAMAAEWALIVFAFMAGLVQLGVATSLIQILFTAIMTTFTLAFGLAFGLGGREKASKFLEEFGKGKDVGTK